MKDIIVAVVSILIIAQLFSVFGLYGEEIYSESEFIEPIVFDLKDSRGSERRTVIIRCPQHYLGNCKCVINFEDEKLIILPCSKETKAERK